jgi:hypothetical protein
MAILYVLDVPEFSSLVDFSERAYELSVTNHGAYRKIEAADKLTISRVDTGMDPAIWFGALVGGFEGNIEEFSEHTLTII